MEMEKEPLVSIVINNYNKAPYIEECLQSVLNQTYTNWEIIFWDDDSTDDSLNTARYFMQKFEVNKVVMYCTSETMMSGFKLNVPLGVTRWLAVKQCQGKYIAFLDSDDVWKEHKLENQVEYMEGIYF